jgi:hypothetical protein
MVDRLAQWDVNMYCTDKWATYASIIPPAKLVQSKATIHAIERNHCRQRHWCGRFKRKSILITNPINSCANGSGIPNLRQMPWSRMHKDSWELVLSPSQKRWWISREFDTP